jgi:hypothetical protein
MRIFPFSPCILRSGSRDLDGPGPPLFAAGRIGKGADRAGEAKADSRDFRQIPGHDLLPGQKAGQQEIGSGWVLVQSTGHLRLAGPEGQGKELHLR